MVSDEQLGAGLWIFGRVLDRYATDAYGPPVSTLQAIDRAGMVGGMKVLDINWPFAEPDLTVQQVGEALKRNGLRAGAVSPAVFNGEFGQGAFTSPDPAVRRKTIDIGKRCAEIAHEWGADYVKYWPGQDGYDYPFQADYQELWDLSLTGIQEVAAAFPDMQFGIEYKLKEPRTHMVFSSAARTLVGIQEIGLPNVGVVYDLGHSLVARETPADVVQLLHRHGRLYGVELNDNWREWDDDMTVGSVHLLETLEFFYALRRINWQGSLLLDQFPYREDPVEAARLSFSVIRALDRLVDRLDMTALGAAHRRQDALVGQKLGLSALLGL
jgi:xylose isomerase